MTDLSEEVGEVVYTVHLPDPLPSSALRSLDHHWVAHLLSSLQGTQGHGVSTTLNMAMPAPDCASKHQLKTLHPLTLLRNTYYLLTVYTEIFYYYVSVQPL